MRRIAAERRLSFEPLVPNRETVEAVGAARRGELATAGSVDDPMAELPSEAEPGQ